MIPSHLWSMRGAYVAIAIAILFFHLLPMNTVPRKWAGPDLLFALTCAWVLRRPDYVPALLVAGVFLLADLLLQRPPGLYAALVVLGCDFLKTRASGLSDASFLGEWTTVAIVLIAITVLNRLIPAVLVISTPPVTLTVTQLILTIAIYPLAVLLSQAGFGVRKPTPADADAMGSRA